MLIKVTLLYELAMKYRSRTDIAAQILEAANGGTTKTKIMYKAFLSYVQLREYLTVLVENGLVHYDNKTALYKTTDKGIKFVNIYNEMHKFVESKEIAELPRI